MRYRRRLLRVANPDAARLSISAIEPQQTKSAPRVVAYAPWHEPQRLLLSGLERLVLRGLEQLSAYGGLVAHVLAHLVESPRHSLGFRVEHVSGRNRPTFLMGDSITLRDAFPSDDDNRSQT